MILKNNEMKKLFLTENQSRFNRPLAADAPRRRGFTLIFAALIGGLLLAIGGAILGISLRELALSGVARESRNAFYAADSGLNCALYWDIARQDSNVFADSGDWLPQNGAVFNCNNQNIAGRLKVSSQTKKPPGAVSAFWVNNYGANNSSCAFVTVTKNNGQTTIESRGRNVADCSALPASSIKSTVLERGLRVRY
jgi:hypothetical protein